MKDTHTRRQRHFHWLCFTRSHVTEEREISRARPSVIHTRFHQGSLLQAAFTSVWKPKEMTVTTKRGEYRSGKTFFPKKKEGKGYVIFKSIIRRGAAPGTDLMYIWKHTATLPTPTTKEAVPHNQK